MAELRTCKVCGAEKPLTKENFHWREQGLYFLHRCRPCQNAVDYTRRRELRLHPRHDDGPPSIPDSDLSLDLLVVEACWQSCVDEGAPAIKRMMTKIVKSCKGVHGSTRLKYAALDYLGGIGDLAMVQRALGECVGLAAAS